MTLKFNRKPTASPKPKTSPPAPEPKPTVVEKVIEAAAQEPFRAHDTVKADFVQLNNLGAGLLDVLKDIAVSMQDVAQKMQRLIELNEERATAVVATVPRSPGRPKKEKPVEAPPVYPPGSMAEAAAKDQAEASNPVEGRISVACAACGTQLTPENISKSAKDGRIIHIGCPKAESTVTVPVIDKVTPSGASLRVMEEVPVATKAPPAPKPPTYEEVYKAVSEFLRANGKPAATELVLRFAPKPQLSAVPQEKYAELLAAATGKGDVLS